ncbi:subtype B tannase [Microbacterium invictum]|uniref:BD-FAE-like domain-containing protein n=1 Tax=Microbacterium invictum TaxID=515415 RepID=A0AA40SS35_9MICO|nr:MULTISPECIES: subtype B tannase [Microbacterium]MBB4141368.1 hypothetical protein [Microbacterium invictum]
MGRAALALGVAAVLAVGALPLTGAAHIGRGQGPGAGSGHGKVIDAEDAALAFDATAYTTIGVTIDGVDTPVRWYKEVCYVADPIEVATTQNGRPIENTACGYQSMNIFVPESTVGDDDTALYFAVNNGGWMASYIRASVTDGASYASATSNVGAALKAGYVFIDVASRSRGLVAADGSYAGKSPAAAVDAKAAVRYLRLNDKAMPGSAERIVINGTSGGGAQVSILGASGNSKDYLPYLSEIGAAGVDRKGKSTLDDDIFAVVAYCPITDMGNADIAYEWLYTVLDTREIVGASPAPDASATLAAAYPAYLKSLKLRTSEGAKLTSSTMIDALAAEVARSAEAFMAADPAHTVPDLGDDIVITGSGAGTYVNDWIDVDNETDTVVSVDMKNYLAFVASQNLLKPAPSFDQTAVTVPGSGGGPGTGESNLYGTPAQVYSNFTEYSWNNNGIAGDGVGLDDTGLTWNTLLKKRSTIVDEQVDLIDPLQYIGTSADTAPYWYVRHGTRDRDTSLTISLTLDRALDADRGVRDVDYLLAWDRPHSGNYDVPEAMAWVAESLAAADAKDAGTKRR